MFSFSQFEPMGIRATARDSFEMVHPRVARRAAIRQSAFAAAFDAMRHPTRPARSNRNAFPRPALRPRSHPSP